MKHESLKVLVDYAQPSLMFINECDCCAVNVSLNTKLTSFGVG